ncbi:MAG: DeoR family transcriptional regulator [Patescibacteria group bacterium]
MATIEEKIVDMLANIQAMRKMLGKVPILEKSGHEPKDFILGVITTHGSLSQHELLQKIGQRISGRTARRHLDKLIAEGLVIRGKDGRQVVYQAGDDLSTKARID